MVVIDDDTSSLAWIDSAFKRPELEILTAADAASGLELIRRHWPQIVLVNAAIPNHFSTDILATIRDIDPATGVILMTAAPYSSAAAMEAIERGACDYLVKPLPMDRLRQRIAFLIQKAERWETAQKLNRNLSEACRFGGCVGQSPLILGAFNRIACIAPHYSTALMSGPPGTGKQLAARALHDLSPAWAGSSSATIARRCRAVFRITSALPWAARCF